jgi:hypothetical protein
MHSLAMAEMISYRREQLQRLARPRRQSASPLRHVLTAWLDRLGGTVDAPADGVGVPSRPCPVTAKS